MNDANTVHPSDSFDKLAPYSPHDAFRHTIVTLIVVQDVEELASGYMLKYKCVMCGCCERM